MLKSIIAGSGPWGWMVFGLALLALETIVPGFYLLWIGLAALATGVLSLLLVDAGFWGWEAQMLAFLALSLLSAYAGSKIMSSRSSQSDQPLLNRRGDQLIGRLATLSEPIVNGRGRVKIGDTLWRISGPDLPAGTTVRVTGSADMDLELTVEEYS